MDGSLCECGCGEPARRRFISGHNGRGKRKTRILVGQCSRCNSPIFATEAAAKARRKKAPQLIYCSSTCRDQYRRSHKGKWHPHYKRVKRQCRICQQTFETIPSRFNRGTDVYCSMECGREGRRRKMTGRRFKRPAGKGLSSIRDQAKQRDNFCCRFCGFREAIHSHHITPKHQGGKHEIDNLITLCPNHHALVHANLLTRDDLIAVLREPIPQREFKLTRKSHSLYFRRHI